MTSFSEWLADNKLSYRGYLIGLVAIYKDGEPMWLMHNPLNATQEDIFKQGREIIDEHLACKPSSPAPRP